MGVFSMSNLQSKLFLTIMAEESKINEVALLFEIKEVTGKGNGWIATKTIPKGSIIYEQSPEISILVSKLDASTLQTAIDELNDDEKQSFHSLMSHGKYDNKQLDIFSCNAIIYERPNQKDTSFGGIFLTFARLNHDCNPNARWFFDEFEKDSDETKMKLTTLRDIKIGEEITVSYFDIIDKRLPTKDRKQELLSRWGFQCKCKWCNVDTNMEQKMDEALNQFCVAMDKCDQIILAQGINHEKQDNDLWKLVYELTNECLIMLTILFNDDINMLWKLYKRRLPALMKLNDIDIKERQKCIQRFNEIYEISRLDFDVEFVATYHALDILKEFKYDKQFMERYPDAIESNKEFMLKLFEKNYAQNTTKHVDKEDSESESDDNDNASPCLVLMTIAIDVLCQFGLGLD